MDQRTDATGLSGHIIVCGLDGIGITIVDQLHRGGQQVVVLSEFATPVQLTAVGQWTDEVISPRGSLEQTLAAAGIGSASAIVCVVAKDLRNVQIALQARHMNPAIRVVSQLGNVAVRRAMAVDNGPGAVIDGADARCSLHRRGLPRPAHARDADRHQNFRSRNGSGS